MDARYIYMYFLLQRIYLSVFSFNVPSINIDYRRCPDELVGYRNEEGRMEQLVYDHM